LNNFAAAILTVADEEFVEIMHQLNHCLRKCLDFILLFEEFFE